MNTSAIKLKNESIPQGFTLVPFAANPRLQVIKLSSETVKGFIEQALPLGVQAIEYKPFLRFHVASILNNLTNDTLGALLLNIIKNRDTGAFMLQCEPVAAEFDQLEFNILLSTAVSHLIGVPNLDAMYGKFYARFSVTNEDNSDSYLRQAHRRMELHNDGTYVEERTDWVIMQKIAEENMEGGDSLLLHLSLIHI